MRYLTFLVFQPFLAPLAWAVVIVVVTHSQYERLSAKTKPTIAALLMTLVVTLILIVPTVLVMTAFIKQGVQAISHVQAQVQSGHFDWVNHLWLKLQDRLPEDNKMDLPTLVSKYFDNAAAFGAARFGAIVKNTASFLFHLSVMILALFYLYRDGESIVARMREVLPFEARASRPHDRRGARFDFCERCVECGCGRGAWNIGRSGVLRRLGFPRRFSGA